jgi:hypothetical protein
MNIVNKNKEAVLHASKKVDLAVNTEKMKDLFMSHQTTGQNHYIKTPNKSFGNVTKWC